MCWNIKIRVIHHLAVRTANVVKPTDKQYAHVYPPILVVHQLADQNVF